MFDQVPEQSKTNKEPEDILNALEPSSVGEGLVDRSPEAPSPVGSGAALSALEAGKLKKAIPGNTQKTAETPLPTFSYEEESSFSKGKILKIGSIGIIGLLFLIILVWGIGAFFKKGDTRTPVETPIAAPTSSKTPTSEIEIEEEETTPTAPVTAPSVVIQIDSDQDGLYDSEENALGTDTQNPDSDADGLSDREEVVIWKTNPLNPDTDGDTYSDGKEVEAGYRPDGPGKLFQIPSSVSQ